MVDISRGDVILCRNGWQAFGCLLQELHDIEVKQQELERQGVKLEKTIRELCEKSDSERLEKGLDNNDRESLGPEAEDLIMQLFELVNEKVSTLGPFWWRQEESPDDKSPKH